jgi:hypothetical protein
MKKILFIVFLFNALPYCLTAQNLQGKVVDSKTNEPLSYISVYLEGTTIGTTTDAQGKIAKIEKKFCSFKNYLYLCTAFER